MNAGFVDRLGAYLLDALLIFAIASVIDVFIPDKTSDISEKMTELVEEYTNGEVDDSEYLNEYYDLSYQLQKKNWVSSLISICLTTLYYVVFAWYNKGATISKWILKLKVVDNKTGGRPSIWQLFLRSMIIYSILSSIIGLILVFTTNSKVFISTYLVLGFIELIFIVISLFFILYRKDKRGLHDIMAGTKVIKESV